MSTYWGYRCKQDGTTTETWFNHGERILRSCVACYPLVQQMYEQDTSGHLEIHIMGCCGHEEGELWAFLDEHLAHGIELCNEYGECEPLNPLPGMLE